MRNTPVILPERFFQIFAGNTRKAHRSMTQNIFTENAINKERNRRYKKLYMPVFIP